MNKFQLTNQLARRGRVTKRMAAATVSALFETLEEALLADERIEIRGFGSFTNRHYDAYEGRNPRTNEPIPVPPKRLPRFRVGKELRERVDGQGE